MLSNSVLLQNAVQAFNRGDSMTAKVLINQFCGFCVSKGRLKYCNKCGLQKALDRLNLK